MRNGLVLIIFSFLSTTICSSRLRRSGNLDNYSLTYTLIECSIRLSRAYLFYFVLGEGGTSSAKKITSPTSCFSLLGFGNTKFFGLDLSLLLVCLSSSGGIYTTFVLLQRNGWWWKAMWVDPWAEKLTWFISES